MPQDATDVTVAGTGAVYVAPLGTPLPDDLDPLAAPWVDVGFVSDDGVTITFSRDTEEINAWQTAEPVRVLTTAEPKTIAFELLQFDRDTVALAFRGGSFTATSPYVYTPPAAGATQEVAMVIEAIDGAETFRWCWPRVGLSGEDIEIQLVRSDAMRLPLTFDALAASVPWQIVSDSDSFAAGTTLSAPAGGGSGSSSSAATASKAA